MKKDFDFDVRRPAQGALDFSNLLDGPAGRHGFLCAKSGKLLFEDGTRIRFFGINVTAAGCMPDKDVAALYAERLAKSGVNMVRLHFADNAWAKRSLIDYAAGNSRALHVENLDRHDFFISELKRRGIYIHTDLFVGRRFQPGDDMGFDDLPNDGGPIKQINIVNRRAVELQKEFAYRYLTRMNPYTGLRHVDDPAVAVVQVMNENSLFWYPDQLWSRGMPLSHGMAMDRLWNEWLMGKYGSREALDEAWTDECGNTALANEEDPEIGSVMRPAVGCTMTRHVDWRADYSGMDSPARYADHAAFLSELELGFCREMREYLMEIGVKCPINISNHARGPADTYTTAEYGDVVESNSYFNHPVGAFSAPRGRFHGKELYSTDPRKAEALDHNFFHLNMVTGISQSAVAGKPLIVTEWSNLRFTKFNSESMLMMAAYGSLQDWDGILLYSYSHFHDVSNETLDKASGFFNLHDDPATWGQMGVCAAIFQGGLVKPARNSVDVCYTRDDMLAMPERWLAPFGALPYVSKVRCRFIDEEYRGDASLALSSGFTPTGEYAGADHALVYSRSPYLDRFHKKRGREEFLNRHMEDGALPFMGIGRIGEKRAVLLDAEYVDRDYRAYSEIADCIMKRWGLLNDGEGLIQPGRFVSDTGEIDFGFAGGQFLLKAEKALAFAGNVRGPIRLGRYSFDIRNDKMTVSLFPRDGKAIGESRHLLLTAVGENGNSGTKWKGLRLLEEGGKPRWVDQIEGSLRVDGRFESCRAYALSPEGERREELAAAVAEDGVIIPLDCGDGTIYFEILLSRQDGCTGTN